MREIEIDLSTKEEIEFRFNQICTFLQLKALSGEEPADIYQELNSAALALKNHFCNSKEPLSIESVNPVLMNAIPTGTVISIDSKQKISAINIMFQEDDE